MREESCSTARDVAQVLATVPAAIDFTTIAGCLAGTLDRVRAPRMQCAILDFFMTAVAHHDLYNLSDSDCHVLRFGHSYIIRYESVQRCACCLPTPPSIFSPPTLRLYPFSPCNPRGTPSRGGPLPAPRDRAQISWRSSYGVLADPPPSPLKDPFPDTLLQGVRTSETFFPESCSSFAKWPPLCHQLLLPRCGAGPTCCMKKP